MARIAIFGSAGQLGLELLAELRSRGHEVAGLDRSQADITDAAQVEAALARVQPGIVINAAAYNHVDLAEKEPASAWHVNGLAVRNLALACRQRGARLVHFSTDYVFDGRAGRPYREDDAPHPVGAYGVSKLAGELYAAAYLERPLIVRTCGVFGPGGRVTSRRNFVELMLDLASRHQPIRVVQDHVASPTYAPALAARTADLLERDAAGVFHLGGGQPISWFDWAAKIFAAAELRPELRPVGGEQLPTLAPRPRYSALSNAKAESLGIAPMPGLDRAIRDYLALRARALAGAPA
jgi:dTDP-4-dehydrorhamnose reductase